MPPGDPLRWAIVNLALHDWRATQKNWPGLISVSELERVARLVGVFSVGQIAGGGTRSASQLLLLSRPEVFYFAHPYGPPHLARVLGSSAVRQVRT